MIRPLLTAATAILDSLVPADDGTTEPGPPHVDVRETCSCGASLMLEGPFDAPTLTEWVGRWRREHPCQPNDRDATHIGAGATTERAWTEPHRTDTDLARAIARGVRATPIPGFNLYPPMGRVISSKGEGA